MQENLHDNGTSNDVPEPGLMSLDELRAAAPEIEADSLREVQTQMDAAAARNYEQYRKTEITHDDIEELFKGIGDKEKPNDVN